MSPAEFRDTRVARRIVALGAYTREWDPQIRRSIPSALLAATSAYDHSYREGAPGSKGITPRSRWYRSSRSSLFHSGRGLDVHGGKKRPQAQARPG